MMTHEQREQFVRDLLTMSGVEEQSVERSVYCALHDALMAAVYFELLGGEEKDFVSKMLKKAQFFFSSKMSLKEKKQSKKKKSTFPPDPLSDKKEKTKKEKKKRYIAAGADLGSGSLKETLDERKERFRQEVFSMRGQYSEEQLKRFFILWSEDSQQTGKMRFEYEKTWNLQNRLEIWKSNQFTINNEAACDRKDRQSKKQAQKEALDTARVEADRLAAQMREEQDRQREEQLKQAKAGKMTPEEFAQLHPDSLMAKMYKEVKSEK